MLPATYAKLRSECPLLGVSRTVCRDQISAHRKGAKMGVLQGGFLAMRIEKLLFNSCLSEVGGSLLDYHPHASTEIHIPSRSIGDGEARAALGRAKILPAT